MADHTTVTIRLDRDKKEKLEEIAAEIGLSVSSMFLIFANTVIRERRIPFEVTLNNSPDTLVNSRLVRPAILENHVSQNPTDDFERSK